MPRLLPPEVPLRTNVPCISSATYLAVGFVSLPEVMRAVHQPLHEVPEDDEVIDMLDARALHVNRRLFVAGATIVRICTLNQHIGNMLERQSRRTNRERVWSIAVAQSGSEPVIHIPDNPLAAYIAEAVPRVSNYNGFVLPRALQGPDDELVSQTIHANRGGDTLPVDIGTFRGDHIVFRDAA